MSDDVTIQFHRTQWDNLPDDVRRLISLHSGLIYPDARGVMTMTLGCFVWSDIVRACEAKNVKL